MAKRRRKQLSDAPEIVRLDGGLCATFVNTASARRKSFETYADLLAWGEQSGALVAADVQRIQRAVAGRPADADAVLRRARSLRACLARILGALADRRQPAAEDLDALNAELAAALPARRLVPAVSGCRWAWGDRGGDEIDRMLWPVLLSAAELLSSRYHRNVHRCANEDCDHLFVDRSPGPARKYCNPKTCGSRARSRRHYRLRVRPRRERYKRDRARKMEEYRRQWEEARLPRES